MILSIEEVNPHNVKDILALTVAKGQETYIETTQQCLEEMKQTPQFRAVGLYVDAQLVGFSMYGEFYELTNSKATSGKQRRIWLDRMLIDANYQGRGYGKAFLPLLIKRLQALYDCNQIYLSVFTNNEVAIKLYTQMGFAFTGEKDFGGEEIMLWQEK